LNNSDGNSMEFNEDSSGRKGWAGRLIMISINSKYAEPLTNYRGLNPDVIFTQYLHLLITPT
jgi:hypothetical protein